MPSYSEQQSCVWLVVVSQACAVLGLVAQLCPTFCDPMGCSPPGSFVHGILQAEILEWVAVCYSRRSSRPRDRTQVSQAAGRFFTISVIRIYDVAIQTGVG